MTCVQGIHAGSPQTLTLLGQIMGMHEEWFDIEVQVIGRDCGYIVCVAASHDEVGYVVKGRYCWHSFTWFPTSEDAEAWVATAQLTAALS